MTQSVISQPRTRLGMMQFFGYAAGDAANNLAFSLTSMFLLVYLTDVAFISPAAVGTLFLVVRIWDGFADLVAGRIVDATMTRWGKFRPFFLFVPPVLLGLSVATFTIPGNVSSGQLLWAYLTYAALGFFYSLVNIPYGSLAAAMTQNPSERSKLATFRSSGAAATQILLALVVAPQINRFRGDPHGLQSALTVLTIIFFVLGILLYLFLFFTAKENVKREVDQPSLKESFAALKHNKPLLMLCLSSLLFLSGLFTQQTALIFYARNVLGNANLYTIMTLLSAGAIFIVGPFIPKMVRTFGKKNSYQVAGLVTAIGGVGIFLAPTRQLWFVFVSFFVMGAGLATVNTLMYSLEADTVEYGEWMTGVRTEGIVYSVFSFTRKVSQALGGAAASYALTIGGYDATLASQPDSAITWIRVATGLVPAILIVLALVIMHFYPLTDTRFTQIVNEITQRRIAGVHGGTQSAGTNLPASDK